jgi:glycosidase
VNAGFSVASKTWLPVNANYKHINAATESKDENSLLNEIRSLLHLRKKYPVLKDGSLDIIEHQPHGILSYRRKLGNQEVIIVLNFSKKSKTVSVPEGWHSIYQITRDDKIQNGTINLNSLGAMILAK